MNRLKDKIIQTDKSLTAEERVKIWHNMINEAFPGLSIRWARIYGRRWSYVWPEAAAASDIGYDPKRITINDNWGLLIDNAGVAGEEQLKNITDLLKEVFYDAQQ